MSDDQADWPEDAYGQELSPLMAPSLAEPAQWLEPVESGTGASPAEVAADAPRAGSTTVKLAELAQAAEAGEAEAHPDEETYTQETLAELAPPPDARLWDEVTAEHSVHALRSLLLGSDAPDLEARLSALERRLDVLAADRANGGPGETRGQQIERRLDALASRLDEVYDSARAGDVTLNSLAGLQRQLEELRLDHVHVTTALAQQIKQADDRCRLRQRRARISSRPELQRLRRRLYARGIRVPGRAASVVIPGPAPVQGSLAARRTPAPASPDAQMPRRSPAEMSQAADETIDVRGAWRAVRLAGGALLRALFILIGVLAHLAWEDGKASWQHLNDLFHGEND